MDDNTTNDTECYLVCSNNDTISRDNNIDNSTQPDDDDNNDDDIIRLEFITSTNGAWIKDVSQQFEIFKNGNVQINFVIQSSVSSLSEEIINEAKGKTYIFDGYITPPSVSGSVVEYNAWADFTSYLNESTSHLDDWLDILNGYRLHIATFEGKIIMYPIDGDIISLYYRKDILESFNLSIPRTWDEYNTIAEMTHGKVFNNQTLSGSCIGRALGCSGVYWANLLISSMTQTVGLSSGHLIDTKDFKFLTTDAVIQQALRWMETQIKFGDAREFDQCQELNLNSMKDGTCVLTYNWGDQFKRYLSNGSSTLKGKFDVAPTPGSTLVLDRETSELVNCDSNICRNGIEYEDIGVVNHAPYLAFGGWTCAVNTHTDTIRRRLAMEFCAFASSMKESIIWTIPNATGIIYNEQDPFRESHLNVDLYVEQGYEETPTRHALDVIRDGVNSPNVVTDLRIPLSPKLLSVLDEEIFNYLNTTRFDNQSEAIRDISRSEVATRINRRWKTMINAYDASASTGRPIFEVYQRIRGVYIPDVDENYIAGERYLGYTLSSIIIFCSLLFAGWSVLQRKAPVVKASQPIFLVMVCFGALVFGSALFPLGIDHGVASFEACSRACISIPWLLALGWTILFSGLFAKLKRVNIVFKNASQFRRLTVTHKDVLLPFCLLLTGNVSVLLTWTIVDPLFWDVVQTSETSSYGTCQVNKSSSVWKACFSLLLIFNITALILANIEAYKARNISEEYGESRYIGFAMGSTLQIFVVGMPLLFLVSDNPSVSYFVRSFLVFSVSMAFLLFLFIPKILIWYTVKPKDTPKDKKALRAVASGRNGIHVPVNMKQSFGGKAQAQIQLLNVMSKIDDLYEHLVADGICASEYYDRIGLKCRKQVEQERMSNVIEESDSERLTSSQYDSQYNSNPNGDDNNGLIPATSDISQYRVPTSTTFSNSLSTSDIHPIISDSMEPVVEENETTIATSS